MAESQVIYGLSENFIFEEAVNFLKSKTALPVEEYKKLYQEAKSKAFTVSGYTSAEVLQTFLDTLTKAAEEGTTKEQFQKQMDTFLKDNGYEGLNPWKSDNIFRTNLQTAYGAGHYKSMTEEGVLKLRPYWQYYTAGDGEVRETHAAMNGRVYAATDPIWDVWYPPNGYKCRCGVKSLSRKQVEDRQLPIYDQAPFDVDYETGELLFQFPDKGFSNNPAKDVWNPDTSLLKKPIKEAFEHRQEKQSP